MTPTVGRTVHFGGGSPGAVEPYAAFVTRVRLRQLDGEAAPCREEEKWVINLRVLDPEGDADRPHFAVPFSETLQLGHWTWPPKV